MVTRVVPVTHRGRDTVNRARPIIIPARRGIIPPRSVIAGWRVITRRARPRAVVIPVARCPGGDADPEVTGVRLLRQSHEAHCHSEQC
jgi:hypothetical protein